MGGGSKSERVDNGNNQVINSIVIDRERRNLEGDMVKVGFMNRFRDLNIVV